MATGPVLAAAFISPLSALITPALSSNPMTMHLRGATVVGMSDSDATEVDEAGKSSCRRKTGIGF
jgi:hypothetical protein